MLFRKTVDCHLAHADLKRYIFQSFLASKTLTQPTFKGLSSELKKVRIDEEDSHCTPEAPKRVL